MVMCTRIYSSCVAEVFRRLSHPMTITALNFSSVNHKIYSLKLIQESVCKNVCNVHLQKIDLCCRGIASSIPVGKSTRDGELKLRSNPNKFGTLSEESLSEDVYDAGDIIEENNITYPVPLKRKLRISQYAKLIKNHLANNEIHAAVDILEKKLIKEDMVKPNEYIYGLVIGACGRYGLTKKAFQLYKKMRDRGLKIPEAVYTALFNACANCPVPKEGLDRAIQLQKNIIEKGIVLNATHHHAMMKAFGRCGDLARAFQIADFMIDKKLPISEKAFNFLLQACASDFESGFRHSLLVWNKMMMMSVKPSIYSFDLMLRVTRDCNMGDPADVKESLQSLTQENGEPSHVSLINEGSMSSIEDGFDNLPANRSTPKIPVDSLWSLPDLLSPIPKLNCNVSDLDLSKPHERLLLLGGSHRFLQHMSKYNVTPTIKTYTLLLDCIPPTIVAEKKLIAQMEKEGIQIDIDFCNMLIKKRSFRFDYKNAEDVMGLIQQEKLLPNIVTFGVLALACTTVEQAKHLVRSMRQAGFRMNVEILGAMLKQGCIQHNFKYVMKILYLAKEEEVKPSPLFEESLQHLILSSREILRNLNNGKEVPISLRKRPFRKEFTTFMLKYTAWRKEIEEYEKANLHASVHDQP